MNEQANMHRYWSDLARRLQPYAVGERSGVAAEQPALNQPIKLNANENPFGPSPEALAAMREACDQDLRLYPDSESEVLKAAIGRRFGLTLEQIFVGNGSNEVLAHTFSALFTSGAPVLFPDICYSYYPIYCQLFRLQALAVPLGDQFRFEVESYRRDNGGIIFSNPNVPTGMSIPQAHVECLLQEHPQSVVVVDESYIDFGGESSVELIPRYPNLLVTQTVSKSRALAGLRVGFAMGQRHLIAALTQVKNSFNAYPLNRVAQLGAAAAIDDEQHFQDCCVRIRRNRELLVEGLEARGFYVLPSSANFVFARHSRCEASALAQALQEQAVYVRHFPTARIDKFLRISVGTDEQQQGLFSALDVAFSGLPTK